MTAIVEKPGHVEQWEFWGPVSGVLDEQQMWRLKDDGDGLMIELGAQTHIYEDDLRELYHPSVVAAVQKRLGIVRRETVGWVVKSSIDWYVSERYGWSPLRKRADVYPTRDAAVDAADETGMACRVVRLTRRAR